jgi:GNAT superfamily N-acetyltransferase
MIIRPFKAEFAEACCDVINASVTAMPGLSNAARFHIISKNVPADLCADLLTGYSLVVELHGQIVAVGSLAENGEIRRVYVSPDVQGQGVGHAIMEKLEIAAQMQGHQQVHIAAAPSAVSFYEGIGYAVVGDEHVEIDGAVFDTMKMTKSLAEKASV